MTFADFGFDERIQKGIDEAGFETPMPVQAQCFNLLINDHRDIYAQSQTGTGKTAAFLLGIFQLLVSEEKYKGDKALVVVPTRELAVQIEREGKMLGKHLDFRIGSVFGGVGYGGQERMLQEGVDILIGTPGRLIDFSKQRKINFKDFGFLVIDEADRLFDMGFLPDLRKILKGMRPYNERHTLLFSATLNARVGNLAWEYMNDPGEVIIEPEKVTVDTVTQELYHVGKDEKMQLLLGVLKRDDPENAVIFTNTRHAAWEVAKRLEVNGYAVEFLMGDLPQSKRLKIVDEVKKGHHKFLVATDVAARGLHIDELEMVINYDVPLEAESYVHRIGRTARAGKEGKTVTMACEEYVYGLNPIEKLLGQKIPVSWAEEDLIIEDKSAGMRFPPQDRYRDIGRKPRDGGGRDNRDRRGSRDNRDRGDSRDSRRREDRRPQGGRGPVGGKKPLDPRAARIQSAVSSIAGGRDEFSEDHKKTDRRADNRSDRSRSEKNQPNTGLRKTNRKKSAKAPFKQSKKPETLENKRISSDTSVDQRLEYYRQKYGEDFKVAGSSGSKKQSKKKRRPSGKQDKQAGPGSKGESSSGKAENRNTKSGKPEKKTSSGKPETNTRKTPERRDADKAPRDNSPRTEKKKGFIGRLFGK